MKNLFKKLLACCMAVCMVLTLCVGAITVSAEAATGTVTAGTANIYTTDAAAVVPVTAYAAGGIAAAEINVAVPANLSIAKLELATTDTNVEVTYASAADPSGAPEVLDSNATASEVAPNVIDGVFTYIIHLPANTVTTAEVTVNITFAGTFAEGTTVVDVVDAEACYDANSDLIDLTIADGAIVATVAHVCTPGTPVEENRVEPKPGVEGSYDSVVYCTVCSAEISRTPATIPALPEEIVPEEDASIIVRDVAVSITSTLDIRVRVRKSVIPADCVRAEIVATPTIYDASYNPTAGTVFKESFDIATASNNLTMYPKNFSLFALDLPMYIQINCYDANDNLYKYSPVYTYYPAEALKDAYVADSTKETQLKLNTAITDLLNMSAAAQKSFAANAGATSALKATVNAGNLVNKDWPQDFASTTEPDYNTISNKIFAEGLDNTTNELRIAADLSGAPILSYTLRKAKTLYPDHSKLSMTISYTSYYGKAAGGEVVSDTIEGDEWAQYVSGNHLVYKFRDCAMYDGNKTITVVVNYDGKQIVKSEYSLESYIAENSTGTTLLADALKSVGMFGASIRAYFSTMGTVDPA